MRKLFPPPDRPLASGFDQLKDAVVDLADGTPRVVGSLTLVGMVALDLCPVHVPTADPPYEDHAPVQYRVQSISVSSTSGNAAITVPTGSLMMTGYPPDTTAT